MFVLLGVLLPTKTAAAQSSSFARLSLREAIDLALQRNATLVGAALDERRLQGAAEGTAGILAENPLLSSETGLRQDTAWSGNRTSVSARIEQPLDVLGQAGSRRRAAEAKVAAARAQARLLRTEVAARVHRGYLAAQIADARRTLSQERLTTARKTEAALRLRVRLGASSDIDLQMATADTARAEAEVARAETQLALALLSLRELLGLPASAAARPSEALLEPPKTLPAASGSEPPFAQHPAVRALAKRGLAIDGEITRLERERRPRISLGLAFERPSSVERFLGLAVSVAPALWRRNQGPLAEAHVERERAEFERRTTLAGFERRWAALVEAQSTRLQELRAVEQMLASDANVRDLVRTGWEAGKFDFLRLLLAERGLADTKQARLELWGEVWSNVIEMNRLQGKEP